MSRALLAVSMLAFAFATIAPLNPADAGNQEVPKTKDRLSQAAMDRLVKRPMAVVRSAGLPDAQLAFSALLANARRMHGANSVRIADLLTAFGVALYIEGINRDNLALTTASTEYLRDAVPAYRAAFSPKHPEVALALVSYADAQLALNPDNPFSVEPMLEEAVAIRFNSLGPSNLETREAMLRLAEVRGSPAIVKGDRERLQRAVSSFENLIAIAPKDEAGLSAPRVRVGLAETYAKNGQSEKAVAELRRAQSEMEGWSEGERCASQSGAVSLVASELKKNGHEALARQLLEDTDYLKQLKCTPPIYD